MDVLQVLEFVRYMFYMFALSVNYVLSCVLPSLPVFTCLKLTIETLEQGVKYDQS